MSRMDVLQMLCKNTIGARFDGYIRALTLEARGFSMWGTPMKSLTVRCRCDHGTAKPPFSRLRALKVDETIELESMKLNALLTHAIKMCVVRPCGVRSCLRSADRTTDQEIPAFGPGRQLGTQPINSNDGHIHRRRSCRRRKTASKHQRESRAHEGCQLCNEGLIE